jgi:DNA polymerase III epsilon subunit-like protein
MAFTPLNKKLVAFLDCETTGLNPGEHEVIEVAILRSDGLTYTTKIKPEHIATAHPKALQVNGYNEEEWKDAPRMKDVIETLVGVLKNCVVVGHNVQFDMGFVKHATEEYLGEKELRQLPYSWVDTVTLAFEHLAPCGMLSLKLDNICSFLGVSNAGNHRALADALRCREVYNILCRATWWDRCRWKWRVRHLRDQK